MHELSIVTNVLDTAVSHAKQQHASRLLGVNLRIGEYKEVVDDALQFSFRILADDDEFTNGAKLNVEYVKPSSICPDCGHEWEHDMFHRKCPECGCDWTILVHGSELEISSIEIEEE